MLYTEVRSFISSIPQKSCISKSKKEAGSEPSLITRRVHIENPDFPLCFHVEKKVSVLAGMTREERKMETNNQLVIIRKIEKYIEYMLTILIKLPRTEKFSIGTEIKTSIYDMLKNILFATKIENML